MVFSFRRKAETADQSAPLSAEAPMVVGTFAVPRRRLLIMGVAMVVLLLPLSALAYYLLSGHHRSPAVGSKLTISAPALNTPRGSPANSTGSMTPSTPQASKNSGSSATTKTGGTGRSSSAGSSGNSNGGSSGGSTGNSGSSALSISVSGNHFVNQQGKTVQLVGVNVSAIGNCIPIAQQPVGIVYAVDQSSATTVTGEIAAWHANIVRIGMNEDCWLGINGVNPARSGTAYQNEVLNFVSTLNKSGIYAVVDLHDNGPGSYVANSQQAMADADHATAYWQSVATTFKAYPAVLFEAYNEPHITTSNTTDANSWDCWLNGCTATETDQNQNQPSSGAPNWQTLGMQSIVNAIRGTGAGNPILLGGLNWSQDLSSFLQYLPTDPKHQLVAAYHNYMSQTSLNTLSYWNNTIAPIANQMPVVTSEMGEHDGGSSYNSSYLSWANSHGVSYIAWAWGPSGAYGNIGLTTDWTSGTASTYGQTFYNDFQNVNP